MSDAVKIPLPHSLQEIVGSLLFASEMPLTLGDLREAIRAVEPEEGENREVMDVYRTCTSREVEAAVKGVGKALDVAGCGISLVCTGGTYRLQTTPNCGRYVRSMLKLDRPARLGRASLETLAIVAYRQPITKSEVEEIRGVDVSGNMKTLVELGLVRLVGKSELPGHPFLYGTTPLFLEHFGLANLEQLNEIDPTLQRSNPKLKAESYRRQDKTTELEEAAVDAKGEGEADGVKAAEKPRETAAPEPKAEEAAQDDLLEGVESPTGDDDGIFIDDTPDEFDDEDEEEDEDENEEEEEGDGEEKVEDEGEDEVEDEVVDKGEGEEEDEVEEEGDGK